MTYYCVVNNVKFPCRIINRTMGGKIIVAYQPVAGVGTQYVAVSKEKITPQPEEREDDTDIN